MLRRPSHLVEEYLADHETVIFDAAPDLRAWLSFQWPEMFIVCVAVVIMFIADDPRVTMIGLIGEFVIVAWIAWGFANRAFTRYVLTEYRALRTSGVLRRDYEWISWKKVTDVSVQRSLSDRWFGTATIRIHSANDHSEFKAMTDVPNPRVFAELIVEMVNAGHGAVPLPGELPVNR